MTPHASTSRQIVVPSLSSKALLNPVSDRLRVSCLGDKLPFIESVSEDEIFRATGIYHKFCYLAVSDLEFYKEGTVVQCVYAYSVFGRETDM